VTQTAVKLSIKKVTVHHSHNKVFVFEDLCAIRKLEVVAALMKSTYRCSRSGGRSGYSRCFQLPVIRAVYRQRHHRCWRKLSNYLLG